MDFAIYTLGDSGFMEQILIGVAMVTSVGTFTDAIQVGLLLGIILIFFQSMMMGAKEIQFSQILTGYIMYAILFVPTVSVSIEDAYTGEVRVVDNVPIGVGAAGGIISTVGYNLTNLFEQGYGPVVPYVTENRFAESLKILNDTRKQIASVPIYAAINDSISPNADIRQSWENYIRECTLTSLDLRERSLNDIMGAELPEALRFDSDLYGTQIYLNDAEGENLTCSAAFSALTSATQSGASSSLTSEAVLKALDIDNTYSGETGQMALGNSINALGVVSTSGTQYLTAAILEPLYHRAAEGRYTDFQDYASATMVNQAIQQRNTQWAAEQSLFMTIAQPMMAFFEGLVYAITPIMAFLLVVGSFGLKLAGKYLQTLAWIQLWLPMMAIINLYIYSATQRQVGNVENPFTSIYALNTTGEILQNWIATGGMLVGATPLIALFVVTGSTYAFTSIAGRINGRDHIDETTQSKNLVDTGPVMKSMPSAEHNDLTGTVSAGASSLMGTVSFGNSLSSMMSSSSQKMAQSQESFSSMLSSGLTNSASQSQTYNQMESLGKTHTAAHGTSNTGLESRVDQIMEQTGLKDEHRDAVKGAVLTSATGGASAKIPAGNFISTLAKGAGGGAEDTGINGKVSASAETATTDTSVAESGQSASFMDALSFSKQEQSSMTNSLASAISTSQGKSITESNGWNDSSSLTNSAQDVVSSNQAYNEANSLNRQFGSMTSMGLHEASAMIAKDSDAMGSLNSYWNSGGVGSATKQEAAELYNRYSAPVTEGGYNLNSEQAEAAARVKALLNSNNTGADASQYSKNSSAALGAVGNALGLSTGAAGDYSANASLLGADNGNLRGQVEDGTRHVSGSVAGAGDISMPSGNIVGAEQVRDFNSDKNQAVAGGHADQRAARGAENEVAARQAFSNLAPEYSRMSAADFYGTIDNVAETGGSVLNSLGHALGAGAYEMTSGFSSRMDQINSDPALRQQVITDTKADMADNNPLTRGLETGMQGILGAAAMGSALARGEIGWSDVKEMDIQEQGMVYQSAMAHSFQSGGQEAAAEFERRHGEDLYASRYEHGLANNLTETQAAVYASAYDFMGSRHDEAKAALAATYGNNPQDQAFAQEMNTALSEASRAGRDHSGSYLTGVNHYNMMTGRGY